MPGVSASRSGGATRLDPIAAAWGGLVGAIGLLSGSGRELPARVLIVLVAFAVGGFLAGVRAIARRQAHALAAVVVAYGLGAAFVVVAAVADLLGGPNPPSFIPHGPRDSAVAAVAAVAAAFVGGAVANRWLRPVSRGKRYS